MPASASARSSSLPAGPTNGWPARSSSLPGCSPTSISSARFAAFAEHGLRPDLPEITTAAVLRRIAGFGERRTVGDELSGASRRSFRHDLRRWNAEFAEHAEKSRALLSAISAASAFDYGARSGRRDSRARARDCVASPVPSSAASGCRAARRPAHRRFAATASAGRRGPTPHAAATRDRPICGATAFHGQTSWQMSQP